MIDFCIKFLICFKNPESSPKKELKRKPPGKEIKKVGTKEKQIQPEETRKIEELEVQDENVVKCEVNAREWCHIEYSLLKNVLPSVDINVVTWGEAAQILTKEDCRSVKTAVINDLVWVYFEMFHKINVFDNEDVITFKESNITFTFSQDSKKAMPTIDLNDWPKKFRFCDELEINEEEEEDSRWFLELQQVDPPGDKYNTSSQILDTYKIARPDNKSIVSMVAVNKCEKSLKSKVKTISSSLPPVVEQPLAIPKKGKVKTPLGGKDKHPDRKEKGGHAQEDTSQLFVDGQLLIAGKYNTCAERKEISGTLRYAAVFANSTKILTDEQDITFVPLIINIRTFEDIPQNHLQKLNVNKVFARYELAGVLDETVTNKFFPQKIILVDETRVFFLSSPEEQSNHETLMLRPSMMLLAEALLTRRFVVKIYGETILPEMGVEPCIFGDRPTDPFISTPGHEMFLNYIPHTDSHEIFLGSASFSLIQLIKGYNIFEDHSILTSSPNSTWNPTSDLEEVIENLQNEEDRRALLSKFTTSGLIPESSLLEHNSRVKLRVTINCQLNIPEDNLLLKVPQVSHRAIIIFKDQASNDKVVDTIERTNRVLLEHLSDDKVSREPTVHFVSQGSSSSIVTLLPTKLSKCCKLNLTLQELQRKNSQLKSTVTGFFVEHEKQSILVLEAMTYVIPPLLTKIQAMFKPEYYPQFICDSSIFFTKRLYMDICTTSIFRIKLHVSLDDLLKDPSFYTKHSTVDESLQTLLLLDLLRRCRTLNSACLNQLFPSSKQLVSFYEVFGTK